MKITFLIGNGFDLNLGLETTYKDFYNNYLLNLGRKVIENNILYHYIDTDIEDWVDFETRLGLFTYPSSSNDMDKNLFLEQAKLLSEENRFIEYELNKSKDFSNKEFLSALTDFRSNFKKYLIQESKKLADYDYQSFLGSILHNGLVGFADDYNDNEKIGIYSNMFQQAHFFEKKRKLSIDYSFLTFNYTDFLEQGKMNLDHSSLPSSISQNFSNEAYENLQISTNIGQVYHIHSKLNGGMFLGVDNESQLDSDRFSKKELTTLIKPLSNEIHNNNITAKADYEIQSSNIIVIYGTALGITDLTWWKKIINFLLKNKANIVLIHKFEPEVNTDEDDFFALEEKKDEIKEHLFSFDKTLTEDNYIDLKKQIFVNLNSQSIFNSDILKNELSLNYQQESRENRGYGVR